MDLTNNKLSGAIPPRLFKDLEYLRVLSLRGNNINGNIPDSFSVNCILRTLDLERNNLGGNIPPSLANCHTLEFMNIGKNKIEDNFPCMLSDRLRVLMLRSNRFCGEIRCPNSRPDLQIINIASNNFSGYLYQVNFSSWQAMLQDNVVQPLVIGYLQFGGINGLTYLDVVTLTFKAQVFELTKILETFTSIDFSCNNFQGEIPNTIGDLKSLYVLNLSHNALIGTIPKSFSNLVQLGSLDLSMKPLTGEIPMELANLTFLSVLNLSYNKLVGSIPQGSQIRTFEASSFQGSIGLCGFTLEKKCTIPSLSHLSSAAIHYRNVDTTDENIRVNAIYMRKMCCC